MTTDAPDARRAPKQLWRVVQVVLVLAAVGGAGYAVAGQWSDLRADVRDLHPNWLTLLGASTIVLGTYAVLIASWRILVIGFGSRLTYPTAARIWLVSALGRYIPGTLWSLVGMGVMAEQVGVQPSAAAGSAIIGTILNIGSGFGVVALSVNGVLNRVSTTNHVIVLLRTLAWVGAAVFVASVVAMPWVLPRVAAFAAKRFSRAIPDRNLAPVTLWTAVTLNVISWFGYGWAFRVFCHAFYPNMQGTLLEFVAVWTSAYVAGFMVLLVPAGIGVRETVLVGLMFGLGFSTRSEATLLSLTCRLWYTVIELLAGLAGLAAAPLALRKRPPGPR